MEVLRTYVNRIIVERKLSNFYNFRILSFLFKQVQEPNARGDNSGALSLCKLLLEGKKKKKTNARCIPNYQHPPLLTRIILPKGIISFT